MNLKKIKVTNDEITSPSCNYKYLKELNSRYKGLEKNDSSTLENLIYEIEKEHSLLFLRVNLNEYRKQKAQSFSISVILSYASLGIAILAFMAGFFNMNKLQDVIVICALLFLLLIFLWVKLLSPTASKLDNAIFLLEEAISIKSQRNNTRTNRRKIRR